MRIRGRSLSWTFTAWLATTTASPLFANDWYVDVNDPNCASGTGSATAPFCKIQEAIDAAYDGDTIRVRTGTYLENLTVAKDLVLIGEAGASATVVDGNQKAAVATIEAGYVVTIRGLTLTHGYAAAGGGLTIRAGADVTIDHCAISSNTAFVHATAAGSTDEVHGGGIAAEQATVTLIGTALDANEAKMDVEGASSTGNAYGGGVWIWQGVLRMQETTFTGNLATANAHDGQSANAIARGAGCCAIESTFDVDSCSVDANVAHATSNRYLAEHASAEGAGAWLYDCTTTGVRFDIGSNYAWGESALYDQGGGLLVEGGSLALERSDIHDNFGPTKGGGLCISWDAVATLIDCNVLKNRARVGGGGVEVIGPANLSMAGCLFDGNEVHDGSAPALDVVEANAIVKVDATRFENNLTAGLMNIGGVIVNIGTLTLDGCLIIGSSGNTMRDGGALWNAGNLAVLRCVVTHGFAYYGGGLFNSGIADVTDSAFVGNSGYAAGSGCYNGGTGRLTLHGCTVAGNQYSPGTYNESTALLRARHTIFTGDAATGAPVFYGTLTSDGYDLLTSKDNCTIVGDETGNQYLVDPLFVDPDGGDYTLQSISPAVDTGDPAEAPGGADAAAHPRWLDGDLDHVRVLDLGAFEFDHAQLTVTTLGIPGASLTVDVAGTSGLYGILVLGLARGEVDWWPFGTLFVDLAGPAWILPIGTQPYTLTGTIPNDTPEGTTFVFQSVAVSLVNGAGNMSNFAVVTVRSP